MLNKPKIAIVGSGISGISAAYYLDKSFEVTLFEKEPRLGGHTHTVYVQEGETRVPVDTGFIVFNTQNYPNFTKFLHELGVVSVPSDMSFSYHDPLSHFWYSSDFPSGVFSQKRNLVTPRFWRFLQDIKSFKALILHDLHSGHMQDKTLRSYLNQCPVSDYFIERYVLPMGAAIWSCSITEIQDFPAQSYFEFWKNHSLLDTSGRPVWRTVHQGSNAYIQAFVSSFSGDIKCDSHVYSVKREQGRVVLQIRHQPDQYFDHVILATHADQTLRLLDAPTPKEKELLSAWRYTPNHAYLHTDSSVMPPKSSAWASWNVRKSGTGALTMSYYMNRLQVLPTSTRYFVTLNEPPHREDLIIKSIPYEHPFYNENSVRTQPHLSLLHSDQIYFCGSYFGYGFHEDGISSALEVVKRLTQSYA